MLCMYCGNKYKINEFCIKSPNERHIRIPDGIHCVYCGEKIDNALTNKCLYRISNQHSLIFKGNLINNK